ncbi:hypothetical protein BDB00DRAFT_277836 [Zychaea mexicana]|uniref:uncharacterized protein n=1 Tax=Zychaea mexicana TaxID=64656 RepID=UPI0022FE483D|nr:uncharacterized protein BDB00DRAFT_277836 [Zychaea mexicana]KAI9494903.1 hypothetical protein BDB00DRAFT_277836 [Zychaea mexicana]
MQTDMNDRTCPKCSSALQTFSINFNCKVIMCQNVKCPYPFDQPSAESLLEKDVSIPRIKKYSKEKDGRSPTLAPNTAPGAFPLEDTIENLLLNARMQGHLGNLSTEPSQVDVHPHGNAIASTDKDKAPVITSTCPTPAKETNYSLQEIENLLQQDMDSTSVQDDLEHFFTTSHDSETPEGSEDGASTPKYQQQPDVTTPLNDQSGLFKGLDDILGDAWSKNCDPFSTELDSLLGI